MREDMFKVIVERPRRKVGASPRSARRYRNSEDAPAKLGIKQGHTDRKWLNENLMPLKRWLESQVNRPWGKVYAELCAHIDRRSTVQEHIFSHIDDFVLRNTWLVDRKVYASEQWTGHCVPIEAMRATLYVHPVTGILRRNKHRITHRQRHVAKVQEEAREIAARRRVLTATEQFHKVDDIWYHVTLAVMDAAQSDPRDATKLIYSQHWDVLRGERVSRQPQHTAGLPTPWTWYGLAHVYAKTKRQLSHAELKRYKLTNAGETRRFFWGGSVVAPTLGACRGIKNIAKPSVGKQPIRFDEGGQARTRFLPYALLQYREPTVDLVNHHATLRVPRKSRVGLP